MKVLLDVEFVKELARTINRDCKAEIAVKFLGKLDEVLSKAEDWNIAGAMDRLLDTSLPIQIPQEPPYAMMPMGTAEQLRDWFAGQALASVSIGVICQTEGTVEQSLASVAYRMADAMMTEREKKK